MSGMGGQGGIVAFRTHLLGSGEGQLAEELNVDSSRFSVHSVSLNPSLRFTTELLPSKYPITNIRIALIKSKPGVTCFILRISNFAK